MNFSQALELIKEDKSVKRANWEDKGIALHGHPYQVHKKILTGEETLHTSHLFIQVYEDDGYSPWSPTSRDLLADDWEEVPTVDTAEDNEDGLHIKSENLTVSKVESEEEDEFLEVIISIIDKRIKETIQKKELKDIIKSAENIARTMNKYGL